MLIKNQCINNEIKYEIKTHLETLTYSYTKSMGCRKSSSYGEIHSDTCLHQKGKKKKKSNSLTYHLKELEKGEPTKPKTEEERK